MIGTSRRLIACTMTLVLTSAAAGIAAADGPRLRPVEPLYVDAEGVGMRAPEGLGCASGKVVVADSGNGRLLVYTVGDGGIEPSAQIVLPQVPYPTQTQIDSKGRIWVVDGKSRRVGRVSEPGGGVVFVDLDPAEGGFRSIARSIALGPDDRLYVVDVAGARVVVVDTDGAVETAIPFPTEVRFGSDVVVDAAGRVFLLDGLGREIFLLDAAGASARSLGAELAEFAEFPAAIGIDNAGNLLVADGNGGSIVVLDQTGAFLGQQSSRGWRTGFLRAPVDLCVSPDGWVFVADRDNSRVQPFRVR